MLALLSTAKSLITFKATAWKIRRIIKTRRKCDSLSCQQISFTKKFREASLLVRQKLRKLSYQLFMGNFDESTIY